MVADNPSTRSVSSDEPQSQNAQNPGFIAAATSLQERRTRSLKHAETFGVFDPSGDTVSLPGSPDGLYHEDTRHLSILQLWFEDAKPILLSSNLRDDNAALTCDLTNPDLFDHDGNIALAHDLIHLRRSRFLWNAAAYERLSVRNFDINPHSFRIRIAFDSDFADLFEIRGTRRSRHGVRHTPEAGTECDSGYGRVRYAYTGLDGVDRVTELCFSPAPHRLSATEAEYRISLGPHEMETLHFRVDCDPDGRSATGRRDFFTAYRRRRRESLSAAAGAATVTTSNEVFDEAIRRNRSDLYTLISWTELGPFPYAGIPWFSTMFGRDALITALQTLWHNPAIALGVLRNLASLQAKDFDPVADAEPGKILHEARRGEMAALGEVPFRRYYGSADSTPLFVMLAGAYHERTNDLPTIRELWPAIESAVRWIEEHGDKDGDGFVEYARKTADGLSNQGWKDSHDSVFHADGGLAQGPIALAEVQAYTYGAYRAAERLALLIGRSRWASRLGAKADRLRTDFDMAFFDEALGTYVLALDGDKRPCRVRASNAGHVLLTGLAFPHRAASVADTIMQRSFFSGWGVRTLASTEARYNPMSYHNGSIWPHDNSILAAGLARYGFRREAARIFSGLFAACGYMDLRRLPELFCGFARQQSRAPTTYPVACSPQAWASGALFSVLQSCLGLDFRPAEGLIIFHHPVLPDFLDEVTLRNLTINDASLDVALRRSDGEVAMTVLDRTGGIRVTTMT